MKKYTVIGLMSGTSLDGLDIACCEFTKEIEGWGYKILAADTFEYPESRKHFFSEMYTCGTQRFIALDHEFGKFLGESVKIFSKNNLLKADFIASHGHTIFHQPEKGFTFQAGNGADINAITGLPVVCDFRSTDVAYSGQGAPLVPIGDQMLFPSYEMCLNLGGIANISFTDSGKRKAYDICPVNIVLNTLSMRIGLPFDDGGKMAKTGQVNDQLLSLLNGLSYYAIPFPKSLGKEWIDQFVNPLMNETLKTEDLMATFCKHISDQINFSIAENKKNNGAETKVLVTGGGAFNTYLIELMQHNAPENVSFIIPEKGIIMFKEALIFAFLGVLRIENQVNALSEVTGASQDSVGGALYGDFSKLL